MSHWVGGSSIPDIGKTGRNRLGGKLNVCFGFGCASYLLGCAKLPVRPSSGHVLRQVCESEFGVWGLEEDIWEPQNLDHVS